MHKLNDREVYNKIKFQIPIDIRGHSDKLIDGGPDANEKSRVKVTPSLKKGQLKELQLPCMPRIE